MVQLEELSKIGFGGYRISVNSKENAEGLRYAIQCGCNLIDTAAGYANGASEKLIGQVLSSLPDNTVFVITKAGYISDDNLEVLQSINKTEELLSEIITMPDGTLHSIHPDYLEAQIRVSLKRLNRKYIDGFLLHSPEYFFDQKNSNNTAAEYYSRIEKAFKFLEEKVKEGVIRYYGVSSNTLPQHRGEPNSTDLIKLLEAAGKVSKDNHFKLIQFPFNLIENEAALPGIHQKSLIAIARENKIVTFSNRPLNANTSGGLFRLAAYNYQKSDPAKDDAIYSNWITTIENQLKKVDSEANVSDISILVLLKENWKNIQNPEAFNRIVYGTLYPFINLIFEDNIPDDALNIFRQFELSAWNHHLRSASEKTVNYLETNNLKYLLPLSPEISLSHNICNEYLKRGIDHVLLGMRKPAYVDSVKALF